MWVYLYKKYTQYTNIYHVNKNFWMRLIAINRLTALIYIRRKEKSDAEWCQIQRFQGNHQNRKQINYKCINLDLTTKEKEKLNTFSIVTSRQVCLRLSLSLSLSLSRAFLSLPVIFLGSTPRDCYWLRRLSIFINSSDVMAFAANPGHRQSFKRDV